ncbi:uncharacterized protein METZ01_LOCUS412081, partial [marine metagenome]
VAENAVAREQPRLDTSRRSRHGAIEGRNYQING